MANENLAPQWAEELTYEQMVEEVPHQTLGARPTFRMHGEHVAPTRARDRLQDHLEDGLGRATPLVQGMKSCSWSMPEPLLQTQDKRLEIWL